MKQFLVLLSCLCVFVIGLSCAVGVLALGIYALTLLWSHIAESTQIYPDIWVPVAACASLFAAWHMGRNMPNRALRGGLFAGVVGTVVWFIAGAYGTDMSLGQTLLFVYLPPIVLGYFSGYISGITLAVGIAGTTHTAALHMLAGESLEQVLVSACITLMLVWPAVLIAKAEDRRFFDGKGFLRSLNEKE